uniref:Uncharacterized protein n=1 Tax=Romanomermis culicivorax TaxID=13658 RepID=A0A915JLG0_ROMCU
MFEEHEPKCHREEGLCKNKRKIVHLKTIDFAATGNPHEIGGLARQIVSKKERMLKQQINGSYQIAPSLHEPREDPNPNPKKLPDPPTSRPRGPVRDARKNSLSYLHNAMDGYRSSPLTRLSREIANETQPLYSSGQRLDNASNKLQAAVTTPIC